MDFPAKFSLELRGKMKTQREHEDNMFEIVYLLQRYLVPSAAEISIKQVAVGFNLNDDAISGSEGEGKLMLSYENFSGENIEES